MSRQSLVSPKVDPLFSVENWITPPAAHAVFRGPASFVLVSRFLPDAVARAVAAALRELEWEDVRALRVGGGGLDQQGVYVGPTVWDAAPVPERLFSFGRPTAASLASRSSLAVVALLAALRSPASRGILEGLSGTELGTASLEVHRMRSSDFIDWHSDDRARRTLVFVVHLSEDVEGGEFEVATLNGETSVLPTSFNSLVVFPVTSHRAHRVRPVISGTRLSINGFFSAP